MSISRIQAYHPFSKKRILRSGIKDCEIVDYDYADPVLEQISKSQPRDYQQKRATIPDPLGNYSEKIKYLMEMKRKMRSRVIIELD